MTSSTTTPYIIRIIAIAVLLLGVQGAIGRSTTRRESLQELASEKADARTLTFAERVMYQRMIEEVYWRHRIWPKENPNPKPSLDRVISQAQLEKKVEGYLRKSQTLDDCFQQPITASQLQAEMDRMAQHTKQPEVLRELFSALGNDPLIVAECLARPVLADRFVGDCSSERETRHTEFAPIQALATSLVTTLPHVVYTLPRVADKRDAACLDEWATTTTVNAPTARALHTAVWTGSEMIVWGGASSNTGGIYDPSTDSWAATSLINAPAARSGHTAVWTGTEIIVWGGYHDGGLNTGGRYNPSTDSWTATSTVNAPAGRDRHTMVWTGSEMIVWGGSVARTINSKTGGRYNPATDSWIPTSLTNVPFGRFQHTAVWTGSEMIVWGGLGGSSGLNTGGRYNPNTNTWIPTSTTNAPSARFTHTAVWTGNEMIIWGGSDTAGGRYDPSTDSWTATSTTNAPGPRSFHTAVWTGREMIIWGGDVPTASGGRYDPSTDSWMATSTTEAPSARYFQTAVWTGIEMIVWGGLNGNDFNLNTGGRYCALGSPAQLGNISTRASVQTGDRVMIGGFIVRGTEPKRVIIRAIGPELTQYGVPNVLANPTLELHDSTGAVIAFNDDWQQTIIGGIIASDQRGEIRNSGYAPTDGRESAIIAELPTGNYTAIVRGVTNMTGVALVEVYDISSENNSVLGNISTRSFVQTGDNVMIGGFVVAGSRPKRLIIRSLGPELSTPPFNVPDPLANPTLELRDSTGALIASNDDWQHTIVGGIITNDQTQAIRNSGYAPTDGRESAIMAELPAGNYTAIVRGVNNTSGVGLVEVYDLN